MRKPAAVIVATTFVVAIAMALPACGKKEPTTPAAKKVSATKTAEEGAEKAANEAPAADKGASGALSKLTAGERTAKARGKIDEMAGRMQEMIGELEGAGGDRAKIMAISKKFREYADANSKDGEALSKLLTKEEKDELTVYAKAKLAPLMSKMMAELMKTMAAGRGGAAATDAPGPDNVEPAEGAVPSAGELAAAAEKAAGAPEKAATAGAAQKPGDKPADKPTDSKAAEKTAPAAKGAAK